jgi:hypothetical protein
MEKCVAVVNGYAIYDHTNENNGWYVLQTKNNRKYFWSLEEARFWCTSPKFQGGR